VDNIVGVFRNPVKRKDLACVLGCESDREARRILAELQKRHNIINMQDGKGYFLADDEAAIRYALQERKRAIKSLNKANEMLRRCQGKGGRYVSVRAHLRRIAGSEIGENQIVWEEQ
jgi:hypothetical protein